MPKYYVATYGDGGIEVTFFTSLTEYNEAVNQAEDDHRMDRIDTYTHEAVPALETT